MWATPNATIANDGETPETWRARQQILKAKGYNGNGAGVPLSIQVQEQGRVKAKLNPLFVEWLMGFPLGWTDFAPVGTEWYRWKRRMRSLLFEIVSSGRSNRERT